MPIIGVGTVDALRAINSDAQLANRFDQRILNKWKMDGNFMKLLKSFEMLLPLRKPSNLTDTKIANKLLFMSDGNLGAIAMILKEAAVKAVETGAESINQKILNSI